MTRAIILVRPPMSLLSPLVSLLFLLSLLIMATIIDRDNDGDGDSNKGDDDSDNNNNNI